MKRIHGVITAGVFGLSLILATGPAAMAQDQEHTGRKVGQKLDELGQTLKRGLKDAGDTIRQQFAKTRESVHNMDLAARVYGRLHWEKCLNGSELELDVKDQVVTLTGTVPDAKARAKAVELARDTEGISEVRDQLTVAASPATSATTSPVTPTPRP